MSCIILVGMMGSGKTTVGRSLAALLDVPFKDTDKMLQHLLGRPIHQLFQFYGEDAFRQHETRMLQDLQCDDCVLSTGGGTVLLEENWQELRRLGQTVFLDVDVEVLKKRLATAKKRRPLLEVPDWQDKVSSLFEERRELYQKADICLSLGEQEHEDVAEIVMKAVREA